MILSLNEVPNDGVLGRNVEHRTYGMIDVPVIAKAASIQQDKNVCHAPA
jgi:hypothetical protein